MAAVFLLALFHLGLAAVDFYTAVYGQVVHCPVTDTARLCKKGRKWASVQDGGQVRNIRLYGFKCRTDIFPAGGTARLRKLDSLGTLVPEKNMHNERTMLFVIMLLTSGSGFYAFTKQRCV